MQARPADATPFDFPGMLKEAGLAAVVVFALAIGLVGFRTIDVPGGVAINFRFEAVAMAVALTFFGRVVLVLIRRHRPVPALLLAAPFTLYMVLVLIADAVAPAGDRWLHLLPFPDLVISWLLVIVAAIFTVRATLLLLRRGDTALDRAERDAMMDRVGARVQKAARYVAPILFLLAVILPFLPMADRRILDIAILVVTYIMLGWGLNIVVGLAGLLDLGYVAFYAVGAYSYALLALHLDLGFWVCLPFAGLMAATAGVLLGFPVLRLRGDYLAIVTLGFGEMVRIILLNWYTFTRGPDGLREIPRPTLFGLSFLPSPPPGEASFHEFFGLTYSPVDRIIFLYYLILMLALVTNLFTLRIRKLPVGRAWEALREDETACRSLGINPRNTKLTAFGIGAMFGGFAGSFFATRQGFISPESFTFIESAVILAIVVLGGFGSQLGVVLAAILLIGLPEFFRELQQYRMLAFGAAMVLIMIWRPAGLLAHREPTIRLPAEGAAAAPRPAQGKAAS